MAQSREEAILENILGADNTLEPPQSRIEALLTRLLEEGGGGGGVVPTPTEYDAGKVPVVNVTYTPGAVIVPEQTVTHNDVDAVLEGVNEDLFTDGTVCVFEINGTTYNNCMIVDAAVSTPAEIGIFKEDGVFYLYAPDGNYTVKLSVASVNTGYALKNEYDIYVNCFDLSNDVADYLIEWDFDAVVAKVRAGRSVSGVLCHHYNYDQDVTGDTCIRLIPLVLCNVWADSFSLIFSYSYLESVAGNNAITLSVEKVKLLGTLAGVATSVEHVGGQKAIS